MSKQKERERVRIKKRQQRSRQLIAGGIVLVLSAGLLFLFFSNRDAENSNARAISRLSTGDFHSLAFSPTEPDTIFFGHHGGLLVSQNGGKDWKPTALTNTDAMALGVPPSSPQTMYAAGHNVFIKSSDGGDTWQSVTNNLPGLDIHAFAADPENESKVFAYIVSFGLFSSEDGGISWEALSLTAPSSITGLTLGQDGQTLYAAAGGAGLWQSQDGGQTWLPIQNVPDNGAIAVAYAHGNGRLYVTTLGNSPGLYASDDNGQSWKSTGPKGTILAIAISPLDPDHIIVVNDQGEVFASRDGGISWSGE